MLPGPAEAVNRHCIGYLSIGAAGPSAEKPRRRVRAHATVPITRGMAPGNSLVVACRRGAHLAVVLAAALLCCAAPAAAKVFSDGALHKRFGVIPVLGAAAARQTSCTTSCSPMTYHSGPVQ